jgi:hypothetical protein
MKENVIPFQTNENHNTNQKKPLKLHASNKFVRKLHNNNTENSVDIKVQKYVLNHKNVLSPQKICKLCLCKPQFSVISKTFLMSKNCTKYYMELL